MINLELGTNYNLSFKYSELETVSRVDNIVNIYYRSTYTDTITYTNDQDAIDEYKYIMKVIDKYITNRGG